MDLKLIGDTVTNISEAIANVLDIDVIVVDKDLLIIGNTYKYMVENDINVDEGSIMATSISDASKKVILDIREFEKCRVCKNVDICKIQGVISIPIKLEDEMIGAIGIMISGLEKSLQISKNLSGITVFLEHMADLLVSKLMSVNQVNEIEVINNEIQHIITNVKDGIVYLDKNNKVAYYNTVFRDYFNIKHDIKGLKIDKVINHTIINNYLFSKKNISDDVFVFQNSRVNFKGLISCINTNLNSEYLGSLITFRKIEETFRVMNEMLNNKSSVKMNQLIGNDEGIKSEIERAKKVAINDGHVMIMGAAGTGKKTLAYSIHNFSDRKSNYVITIDCKYLPREHYLSELFGIGESMINLGMMQLADKGTIVFNEITDLPLNIQLDLLTYITKGEIELEQGIVVKDIDVRIIATTKYDIRKKIAEGYFNEELFYRLNVNSFNLKKLNDRKEDDFRRFVHKYLETYSKIFSKPPIQIEPDGIELMHRAEWGESLKGLERFIEQVVYSSSHDVITKNEIADELHRIRDLESKSDQSTVDKIKSFDEYEREIIANALSYYDGVKNKIDLAADKLGIGRATLYRKINKHNLM